MSTVAGQGHVADARLLLGFVRAGRERNEREAARRLDERSRRAREFSEVREKDEVE